MNLIRPDAHDEPARRWRSLPKRLLAVKERRGGPTRALDSLARGGWHGVVEDGMVGKWCELSRESHAGAESAFMARKDPKNRRRAAVRASIGAWKRGNARGAKGRRKMDAP
jgi:hypothetical protein